MSWLTPIMFAQENGAAVSVLDQKARWRAIQSWREIFASAVKTKTGKWTHRGFEWHAFSYRFARSHAGPQALELYRAENARELYVIPEDERHHAFVVGRVLTLLDFSPCGKDVVVFPPSLAWTIAFTHEQPDFGPYFSRAEWCLN